MFSENAADTREWVRAIQAVAKGAGLPRKSKPSTSDFEVVDSVDVVPAVAKGTVLGRRDAAPPPIGIYGEIHSHTEEFMRKRSQLTRRVVDTMECIRTRVDKYLKGDPKRCTGKAP